MLPRGETLPIAPLVHAMLAMDKQALDEMLQSRERTGLVYDCTRTERELEADGIHLSHLDTDLLRVYLRGLEETDGELSARVKISERELECVS